MTIGLRMIQAVRRWREGFARVRAEHPYVLQSVDALNGQPYIAGTRVSIVLIARLLDAGQTVDEIALAFPHVPRAAIVDAASYCRDHAPAVDRLVRATTRDALAGGLDVDLNRLVHQRMLQSAQR